ncbi:anti-sigma factor antagonist [Streptomyces shenzhenensis]|uniref:anti-sigma factor antagonist n=1 Tax=Streptomyces shenzhenensis TaxID=943815 RepID=UPI0015F02192|nr:anti-sigma factor antagonist [Streptomyces shenzhenensis]
MPEPEQPGTGRTLDPAGVREPPDLTIRSRDEGKRVVVTVCGDLDLTSEPRLRSALRAALLRSSDGIELDLRGVGFCDCSGLNVLLNARRQALKEAKRITLRQAGPAVRRILEITGALALFPPDTVPDGREDAEGAGDAGDGGDSLPAAGDPGTDLRAEVVQLRRALQTRDTIDLARGILMAAFVLTPEEAWRVLVATSQNTNTKLHRTAGQLVDSVRGGPLPAPTRKQLSAAVTQVAAARVPATTASAT